MKRSHIVLVVLVILSTLATSVAWIGQKSARERGEAQEETQKQAKILRDRTPIFSSKNKYWQPAPEAVRAAAQAAILFQLQAFKRDDYFAATRPPVANWQKRFPSVAVFRAMLKQFFPQFARNKSVKFGAIRWNAEEKRVAVRTTLTSMDGTACTAVYLLSAENDKYMIEIILNIFVVPQKPAPVSPLRPARKIPAPKAAA